MSKARLIMFAREAAVNAIIPNRSVEIVKIKIGEPKSLSLKKQRSESKKDKSPVKNLFPFDHHFKTWKGIPNKKLYKYMYKCI